VVALLRKLGLEDNTLVVVTSDNGATHDVGGVDTKFFDSVGGLRGLKGSCHEGGLRVPFIVRWPGHSPIGSVSDEIVAFPDMFPTICDLVGAPAPQCDGISLRRVFEGSKSSSEHPPVVYDYPEYGGQQAIIEGKWKLIRKDLLKPKTIQSGKPTPWELYDLIADRNETTNLAASHPELVSKLAADFAKERTMPAEKNFRMNLIDAAP
jgi:arylsulfatase